MRWDVVEREFVIIARDLERLSKSFTALAVGLHNEREYANMRITREDVKAALRSVPVEDSPQGGEVSK